MRGRSPTHGGTGTPEFNAWQSMHQRCTNSRCRSYKDYGARGIKVCKRWLKFENFLADMGRKPSPQHSIDRKDNDGDYTPKNCRWATSKEQGNNRRTNTLLTYKGRTAPIKQWAKELGVVRQTIGERLARGWSVERALTQPIQKKHRRRKDE